MSKVFYDRTGKPHVIGRKNKDEPEAAPASKLEKDLHGLEDGSLIVDDENRCHDLLLQG